VIGPSRAGKTELLGRLTTAPGDYGLSEAPSVLDLDETLGPSHRSDAQQAVVLIGAHASTVSPLVVNVGAGQLVQPVFRQYLLGGDGIVPIAVWCSASAFRTRHSPETADREYANSYPPELVSLYESCRARGHLVDTSSATAEESAQCLSGILQDLASQKGRRTTG
jgi:hypothetical protein